MQEDSEVQQGWIVQGCVYWRTSQARSQMFCLDQETTNMTDLRVRHSMSQSPCPSDASSRGKLLSVDWHRGLALPIGWVTGEKQKSQTANLGPQTWFPLGQIEYKEANLLLFIVSKDRPKICLFWKESSLALLPQLVLGPWQHFLSRTACPPEHTWTTCKATRDPFPWVACGYTCAQSSFFIWRWIGGFRAWIGFMTSNSFHPFQKSRPKYNNKKI